MFHKKYIKQRPLSPKMNGDRINFDPRFMSSLIFFDFTTKFGPAVDLKY